LNKPNLEHTTTNQFNVNTQITQSIDNKVSPKIAKKKKKTTRTKPTDPLPSGKSRTIMTRKKSSPAHAHFNRTQQPTRPRSTVNQILIKTSAPRKTRTHQQTKT
jgi:hypothetical protein